MATAQIDVATHEESASGKPRPRRLYETLGFWTALAVTLGILWRMARYLLQFPIWGDESFVCVNFLDNTFSGLLGPLRVGQICPLTFLWSELALYDWLGPSELVMRLLPLLAGLAALALFWPLCRRVLPPVPASLAMGLLAVSYYPVRHAVEVKPYSEDLLVTLCLLLPAVRYLRCTASSRWLAILALFVPVAIVSSYTAVLVAGAVSLAILPGAWRRRERSAQGWFVTYNLLLLGAFVGNYYLIGKPQLSPHVENPHNAFNSTWQEWFPDPDPLSLLWWFVKAHTGNMFAYPMGGPNFGSSLTTILCLVGAWSWWRRGDRQVLALLGWPFVLSMIAALLHKYPYGGSARLDQHLAPAICLLLANGVVALIQRCPFGHVGRRRAVVLVAASLALFAAGGMIRDMIKPFKTTAELWNRDFVQDLMARMGPHDRVVMFHGPHEVRAGLEWYLRQHDDRVNWNGALASDRFSPGKIWCVQMFVQKPAADPVLTAIAQSAGSWVRLDYFTSVAPPEHGDDPEVAEVSCYRGSSRAR